MQKVLDWLNSRTLQQKKQLGLATVAIFLLAGFYFSNQQTQVAQPNAQFTPIQIASTIRVHVVGEVKNPGLYELSLGAIANDAISLAGGLTNDAAESSVNLARVLTDGEQLTVLSNAAIVSGAVGGKVSINRATASDLEALPGIGPALAERIVSHRQQVGAFSSIEELTSVSGIGPKLFAAIKDELTL